MGLPRTMKVSPRRTSKSDAIFERTAPAECGFSHIQSALGIECIFYKGLVGLNSRLWSRQLSEIRTLTLVRVVPGVGYPQENVHRES